MPLDHKTSPQPDFGATVVSCDAMSGFSAIGAPRCGAVIYERAPDRAALQWLASLAGEELPDERIVLRPDEVEAYVLRMMPEVSAEHIASRRWLVEDITALSKAFATLMEAPYLRLRLDPITTNACRKFHIDAVTARLVCTYRGQSTQYGMGNAAREVAQYASVPEGCPIVLRGTKWPGDAPTGLLHRSPPIEGTGETRLLLVLDPVYRLEDA